MHVEGIYSSGISAVQRYADLISNISDFDLAIRQTYSLTIRTGANFIAASAYEYFSKPLPERSIQIILPAIMAGISILSLPFIAASSVDFPTIERDDILNGLLASASDSIAYAFMHEVIPSFVYHMLE